MRSPTSLHPKTTGTLSFLTEGAIARMAIDLLPFFQCLVIKCGERGVTTVIRTSCQTKWASERGNTHGRYIVSSGSGNRDIVVLQHFPAREPPSRIDRKHDGSRGHVRHAVLASLVQDPRGFEDPESLKEIVEDTQAATGSMLKSEYMVSPSLSLYCRGETPVYLAWFMTPRTARVSHLCASDCPVCRYFSVCPKRGMLHRVARIYVRHERVYVVDKLPAARLEGSAPLRNLRSPWEASPSGSSRFGG